ncbi:uncharacterized protein LOC111470712 [Cucurbita maxima]|uniref:Uncharacterized protein LOC111470712 n=1 Tax=Cucurbita maxima TaxID=3661 RepID=A0A6J1I8T9_CUCMA|nr:uncharacterized protein LOC111470712 [Cucurbita maxima]
MAKGRGKALKVEELLNHSISNKGVKKYIKKKKSRKENETSNSKVSRSSSSQEPVSIPTQDSVTSLIPPSNDQEKYKETEEKKHVSGFIFMCNGKTKSEFVKNIAPDAKLFLFDTNLKLLYGIYQASSKEALDLEPRAFDGQFQAQVKFKIFKDCLPLPESAFKKAIKDNYDGHRKFRQELSSTQVKHLISLFRPIAKNKTSHKESHVCPNVANRPSFRSTRTKVVKSYPLENLSSAVHYFPDIETRPQHDHYLPDIESKSQHDVRHVQYDPFEPGLHFSHSQVQPRLVRVEAPPRHVEAYHPEHAHEAYFRENSLRYPPNSYESIRNPIETYDNGDLRDVYGRRYHAPHLQSDRVDDARIDFIPRYYSQWLSPTASHTAPLSQAAYHSQNRLPSPYRSQHRFPSPHRSYYSPVASQDGGRDYAGLPQGGPASGSLSYGMVKQICHSLIMTIHLLLG